MGDATVALVPRPRTMPGDGRRRVVIEGVWPEIDAGRFPIKRVVGEHVWVEADVFTDSHDDVACVLRYRHEDDDWRDVPMEAAGNDRWRARFTVEALGTYRYTVQGWVDRFGTWVRGLRKKVDAGQDVTIDLAIGADLVRSAARRATGEPVARLRAAAALLRTATGEALAAALDEDLAFLVRAHPDRRHTSTYARELHVTVDRERARSSAWYELFPRSTADEPGRHGTFDDVIARLPYVAELGFDVLYLPPIHPIGRVHRKGRNNTPTAGPDDPGSPWAIGSEEGGHTAVHPQLGTLEDFDRLVAAARRHGIEVALDIAFQCAPDHAWVREHPEWFRHRPDGTVQYAENPPKRYEDIYPLDFDTAEWKALWEALLGVFRFWIQRDVRIFRVDNPHTKPFAFWEWAISQVKAERPDVIFLSEAFTRPKVMYRLAKLGFTQSYTYFAWRNTKQELTDYLTELTRTGAAEFFRPSFWPNTPDILTAYLQEGDEPAFAVRVLLAATLAANYGIYGPAFERCEAEPREPGSEEYRDSEKYEVRRWHPGGDRMRELIGRVNRIRHEHRALQTNDTLRFHGIGNDALMAYSKVAEDGRDPILVIANLDPVNVRSGWTDLSLPELGVEPGGDLDALDLLTGDRYRWHGERNFVELDPAVAPGHVLSIRPVPGVRPVGRASSGGVAVRR